MSGVGICDPLGWTAPIDPHRRYDDRNIRPESCAKIRTEFTTLNYILRQDSSHDAQDVWGFLFHSTCWTLLANIFQPRLQDILAACLSMPCRFVYVLNWGHDYGGAIEFISERAVPNIAIPCHSLPRNIHMNFDPVDIPELQHLLWSPVTPKTAGPAKLDNDNRFCVQKPSQAPDRFTLLPPEILQELLILLQSKDVASFRLASRTIASLALTDTFWKSRFLDGYEYASIFEARESRPNSWRALYDGISRMQAKPGITNRKRIWSLALQLRNTLEQMESPCYGRPVR